MIVPVTVMLVNADIYSIWKGVRVIFLWIKARMNRETNYTSTLNLISTSNHIQKFIIHHLRYFLSKNDV